MPGGGLFALVAYGSQNVYLSGNPDFTYFYKAYKKYSHFAEESVSAAMDGPSDLSYDQPILARYKIQRIADLIRDIYVTVHLPDIYCKYIPLPTASGRQAQYNFAWSRYIGCHMIQSVSFRIGGQTVQEFDGAYLIAKAQCDLDAFRYAKWQRLVGDVPELYDPATGMYGGGQTGTGYPLVYNNNGPTGSTTTPANVNRPSIQGRVLQIPIPFWFAESTYESLPLVALQQHECEIQVVFRPIRELYRVLDPNGYQVAPGYQYHPSPLPVLQPNNVYYTALSDQTDTMINQFLTDVGTPVPLLNTWPLRPQIQMTYVYVTDEERAYFAKESLQYLTRQVTRYTFDGLKSRQYVLLSIHNPIERLLIVPRRSDSLEYRNQSENCTNWVNPKKTPFIAAEGGWSTPVNLISATGQQVMNGQRSILQGLSILGDGNLLQEEKPIEYFTQVIPWKYMEGMPMDDVVVYPFSLASPSIQPHGSINSSRIKNLQLDLNVNPLPANSTYNYTITVYVENLNWITISSGMGGLKFAK